MAVFLVVVHHVNLFHLVPLGLDLPIYAHKLLAQLSFVRMPTLCLISGLFAARALRQPLRTYLRTRVAKFFYLYAIWAVIEMVAYLIVSPEERSVHAMATRYLTAETSLWYLLALAFFYSWWRLTSALPRWLQMLLTAAVFVMSLAVYMFPPGVLYPQIPRAFMPVRYLIVFMVGAWWGPQLLRIVPRIPLLVAAASGIAFLALNHYFWNATGLVSASVYTAKLALALISFSWVVCFLDRLRPFNRATRYLGRRTLPVYTMHMPIIMVSTWLLAQWNPSLPSAYMFVALVLSPLAMTLIALGIYQVTLPRLPALYDLPK